MLIKVNKSPIKNPIWEYYTPNELYDSDILSYGKLNQSYAEFISAWQQVTEVSVKNTWFEVRIVTGKTSEEISDEKGWWRQPEFMDKIFWVFQTPQTAIINNHRYYVYLLEPFESMRVVQVAIEKFGYNPFPSEFPAMYLPVECSMIAWTETSNGHSDHGRHRGEIIKTQQEIDDEETEKIESEKFMECIVDVTDKADEIVGKL